MGKLVIGPEGFVDLRKNPPATTVTVQGFTPEPEGPRKLAVTETLPEPPAEKREEVLPGRQKTTEGLETSVAEPVKVKRQRGPIQLERIHSQNDPSAYVIVTRNAWNRLGRHRWFSTRSGHFYRKVKNYAGLETVIWLHRVIKHCNQEHLYVAFLDGDQRNLTPRNLKVVNSKEEVKAIRHAALQNSAGRTKPAQ